MGWGRGSGKKPTSDPGSQIQGSTSTGSRIRIRKTGLKGDRSSATSWNKLKQNCTGKVSRVKSFKNSWFRVNFLNGKDTK
jgi:hypothetical protein